MRTSASWVALCVLGLAAAGCQREPAKPSVSRPEAAPAAVPAIAAVPAAPAAPAVPPETQLAVNQALAAAQAYNAKTAADLAEVGKAQQRIHDLATQAQAAARGGQESERPALSRKVAAARAEADAAHASLGARQAAFSAGAQAQVDAVAAALVMCGASPEFAASEPCANLLTEQATLTKSTTALAAKFTAAEAAYQKDRAALEEASATMALGFR